VSDFQKISEFIVDVEDLAKERGLDAFSDIPFRSGNKVCVIIRFDDYDTPPDLGVHVTDGIKPEMKRGE